MTKRPAAYVVRISPGHNHLVATAISIHRSGPSASDVACVVADGVTTIAQDAARVRALLAALKIDWRDVSQWHVVAPSAVRGCVASKLARSYHMSLCRAFAYPADTFPAVRVAAKGARS